MTSSPGQIATAQAALQYLYDLRLFGTKLGLDNPRRLAAHFGSPQNDLKLIHVAGTNGKGSVCAMLESIYRNAGYKVGLFTSPHLVQFGERIQVDRSPLSDEALVALVNQIQQACAELPEDLHPTFFEVVVVMGLLHFRSQGCDLVIWETGLGGRLDATNIVTPLLSIITNVSLDHQKWLGETEAEIAREKAGIIKPEIPVVHGLSSGPAQQVVHEQATALEAPLYPVTSQEIESLVGDRSVALLGTHQQHNAAIALQAVRNLNGSLPVSESAETQGLRTVQWPGRLQMIHRGDQDLLLDGSHNDASVEALCQFLDSEWSAKRVPIIFGVLEDKGIERWLGKLVERATEFFLVPVPSGRGMAPEQLAEAIRTMDPTLRITLCENVGQSLDLTAPGNSHVLLCGSVYLIGEALGLLGKYTVNQTHRALNDWGGVAAS